ncbi:ATP-grasp domain-containing protein [Ramlibacter sp.]|uniref:ATP-grasp domain-containing protein n=1 Tax=Ramlibacter sp. TaxID=1917967 RepID=UPI0017BCA326|nr:ATP-grasp domain-containing protein [Ramlibacter sp.]MBA2674631.1 ATP-grasp domain-containing protein [Ramlibacter sp.]
MSECFVVFEPVNHMYKLIEAARHAGIHTVVFHTLDLATGPIYKAGLESIDESWRLDSWDDEEATLRFVNAKLEGRRVRGTYGGVEPALPLETIVRRQAGLPTHGPELMRNLLNKKWVRSRLRDAGLTRLRMFDPRAVLAEGRFPEGVSSAFLKPIQGLGSIHVTHCRTLEDLARGLDVWDRELQSYRPVFRHHLTSGGLFLEEGAMGELMSVEGWVANGSYTPLGIASRTVLSRDVSIEMGAQFPYPHPLLAQIVEKITAVHKVLGLVHGPTHAELIVTPAGEIELVEMNVRFGGYDFLLMVSEALDLPLHELLLEVACGGAPALQPLPPARGGYVSMQMLLAPGGTERLDAVEADKDAIFAVTQTKPTGHVFASTDFQNDQILRYLVRDASYEGVLKKAAAVRYNARVNGKQLGNDPNNVVQN